MLLSSLSAVTSHDACILSYLEQVKLVKTPDLVMKQHLKLNKASTLGANA